MADDMTIDIEWLEALEKKANHAEGYWAKLDALTIYKEKFRNEMEKAGPEIIAELKLLRAEKELAVIALRSISENCGYGDCNGCMDNSDCASEALSKLRIE